MVKIAIVYASATGNTKALMKMIEQALMSYKAKVQLYPIKDFCLDTLTQYDAVIIGTYSWGNGEIPDEMLTLYRAFECQEASGLVTGVAGTGDQFYPNYCGAVNEFRDMLYVRTNLAATLKIELMPQVKDQEKCRRFAAAVMNRIEGKKANVTY